MIKAVTRYGTPHMNHSHLTLTIIVVNYNGLRFLEECIKSLEQFVSCEHEVIIVDNASSDGSADYIATHFPNVQLIRSETNLGFAGGNNIGARAARGELLLLLNNDTKLLSSIEDAVSAFNLPEMGVAGAHLFYEKGTNQPSVGYEHTPLRILLSWLGASYCATLPSVFRRTEHRPSYYDICHDHVAWVSGAFLMTRHSLWNLIGGLDEKYFMYMEDVDYCKQVRDKGFTVAYIPTVSVIHYEGGGKTWIGQSALTRTIQSYRIYLEKHYGQISSLVTGMLLSPIMAIRVPYYYFRFRFRGSIIDLEKSIGYAAAASLASSDAWAIGLARMKMWAFGLEKK